MSHDVWVVLPLLVPLFFALLTTALRKKNEAAHRVSLVGTVGLFVFSGILAWRVGDEGSLIHQFGGWSSPFGIVYVADALSVVFLVATAVVAVAVAVIAYDRARRRDVPMTVEPTFFQLLLAGAVGALLTGDWFHLFVCFEVMLLASYALMSVRDGVAQPLGRLRRTMHYVVLNAMNSLLFLLALGVLYGTIGTLNMEHIQRIGATSWDPLLVSLLGIVFALKAGIGLSYWLPQAYRELSPAVTALFAGLMTKIAFYALLRMEIVWEFATRWDWIGWLAVLTMGIGMWGSWVERSIGGILAYQIVLSVGLMGFALAVGGADAFAGLVLYAVCDMLGKTVLFLCLSEGEYGASRTVMRSMGQRTIIWMSVLIVGGLPPFGPFIAKVLLFRGGIVRGGIESFSVSVLVWTLVAGVASLVALMTLVRLAMRRTGDLGGGEASPTRHFWVTRVVIISLLVTLSAMGWWADVTVPWMQRAAELFLS